MPYIEYAINTDANDIKILLHSFTCWYLTIWWIATITIIQTCYERFENECQALTSSSEMSLEFLGLEFKNDLSQVWHVDRGS